MVVEQNKRAVRPPDREQESIPTPVVVMWSGGKDALLALDVLTESPEYEVRGLLITVLEEVETVTAHGTPLALIEAQAEALGHPLHVMRVPPSPSNATYEEALERTLAPVKAEAISTVAIGDLYLEDIRSYRESLFERLDVSPLFPLWKRDTTELAHRFLDRGYEAVVTSVDTTQLDGAFAGRSYDEAFLTLLPDDVDPCGENGEFHTFVTDGPLFGQPVPVTVRNVRGEGRMTYARIEGR